MHKPSGSGWALLLTLATSGCPRPAAPPAPTPPDAAVADPYAEVERSEELLTQLNRRIPGLEQDLYNLALPAEGGAALFADTVAVQDLDPAAAPREAARAVLGQLVQGAPWPAEKAARTRPGRGLRLLQPFVQQVRSFEHAHFAFVRGAFQDPGARSYLTEVKFQALATLQDGQIAAVKGKLEWLWQRDDQAAADAGAEDEGRRWRIHRFAVREFNLTYAPRALFSDVMERALPDAATRAAAHDSFIERFRMLLILTKRGNGEQATAELTRLQRQSSADTDHAALAVVDIDGDGLDDLYVMPFSTKNLLLRNRGDGTFVDVAPALGLDLKGVDAGLFADFDNDGDKDLMVGGFLDRARYLMNERGRFVDRTATHIVGPMPAFVSSMAAADYDQDGLLDIYLSTYAAVPLVVEMSSLRKFQRMFGLHLPEDPPPEMIPRGRALSTWLTEAESRELFDVAQADDINLVLNRPGPPNVLLHNLGGGRLGRAEVPALKVYANTYQSMWTDYDNDGDPDVVVVNDWGKNRLVRNDGGGKFTDVTKDAGLDVVGDGMGVSAADYDNDGWLDLYVTNMFSKAGMRITGQLGDKATRFAPTAEGNLLYRNDHAGHFRKTSGLTPDRLQVQSAGWAWGGQFFDADNDGFQDLFVVNGYYTAPRQVALPDDL